MYMENIKDASGETCCTSGKHSLG